MRLDGIAALVTGAASGLGAATAEELVERAPSYTGWISRIPWRTHAR
jgi:NAD(P)-dependent dehydrogenase (short-subunit alcohol dehydrogenase family)